MRDSPGFTLLEVLVAFTIFALVTAAVMASISTGLKGSRTASHYGIATLIAESKIAAVGIERPVEESAGSGTTDEGYNWQIAVHPYLYSENPDTATGQFRPVQVDVTVNWSDSGKQRSVSLSGIYATKVQ